MRLRRGENTQLFWEVVQKIDGRLGSNYKPDPDWTDAMERRAEKRKEKLENELNSYRLRFKPCSATLILASPPISSTASRRLASSSPTTPASTTKALVGKQMQRFCQQCCRIGTASYLLEKMFDAGGSQQVKVVRETMNQMVEAWREIPDVSDEVSLPGESQSSSKEVATDECYLPGSKTSHTISSGAPQVRKNYSLANGSPACDGSSPATASKEVL